MTITASRPEMGGPYPQHRGGVRHVYDPHGPAHPDDTRIVHPIWPARAPVTLSQRTIDAARRLDRCMHNYLNAPPLAARKQDA